MINVRPTRRRLAWLGSICVSLIILLAALDPTLENLLSATTALCTAALFIFIYNRRPQAPTTRRVPGGLQLRALPLHTVASASIFVCFALLMLNVGLQAWHDPSPGHTRADRLAIYLPPASIPVFGLALWMLVNAVFRNRGHLTLTPESVTLSNLLGQTVGADWTDLKRARLEITEGVPVLHLHLRHRPTHGKKLALQLTGQSWPPETIAAIINWHIKHPEDRPSLTDPSALDRWLPTSPTDHD